MDGAEPGTLLFFWDYDTQWAADRSRAPGGRADWGRLEFEHTERLLELHAQYGIPACFAVVGASALPGRRPYSDPAQVRRIHEMGHEVASHSFRHEWLPGVGRSSLLETLRVSKDALEQCIGARVTAFVPPYNQPFDYPRRWSFSLSERRGAREDRIDIPRLAAALAETGYRFCRVSYRSLPIRLAERMTRRPFPRPSAVERIGQVACVRLNTPGGFDGPALAMLEQCARAGGFVLVYGHPHSLRAGNAQDEARLVPFLRRAADLSRQGAIRPALPRQIN